MLFFYCGKKGRGGALSRKRTGTECVLVVRLEDQYCHFDIDNQKLYRLPDYACSTKDCELAGNRREVILGILVNFSHKMLLFINCREPKAPPLFYSGISVQPGLS